MVESKSGVTLLYGRSETAVSAQMEYVLAKTLINSQLLANIPCGMSISSQVHYGPNKSQNDGRDVGRPQVAMRSQLKRLVERAIPSSST